MYDIHSNLKNVLDQKTMPIDNTYLRFIPRTIYKISPNIANLNTPGICISLHT